MTDWLRYIASHADLIAAFGTDVAAAEQHYNNFGRAEGRTLTGFDPLLYGASNTDVALAFGADETALERHYIIYGAREGRATGGFDALSYGASNPDLARAFGADVAALERHYINLGIREGRATSGFDALAYAAVNRDVALAFGGDTAALTRHYLSNGAREGRATSGFDAVGYLLSNADLAGMGPDAALRHWVAHGIAEGRGGAAFGADQAGHDAAIGRVTAGTFDGANDQDWFQVTVAAGQKMAVAALRPDLIGSVVGGAVVRAFDAGGRQVASATMGADGFDHWLQFTAPYAGTLYLTVEGHGATGAYQLAAAQVGPDYVAPASPTAPYTSEGFIGGALTDVYLGGNGFSVIQGGGGDDILGGGAGQDDFLAGPGADYMDGGSLRGPDNSETDSVSYQYSPAGVVAGLDGRQGVGGWAEGDRLFGIETLFGSDYADKLYAGSVGAQLNGAAGNDELYGGSGNDYFLYGGDGDDKIYGFGGQDSLAGGKGADLLDGGAGFDTADYQTSDTGVRVDLRSGAVSGGAAGDTLVGIEEVIGSYSGNDVLATAATTTYQVLLGYGGDDILIDRSTAQDGAFLAGNAGNDLLIGSRIRGDEGNDTLVAWRERVINFADGQTGADTYVVETGRHGAGAGAYDFSLYIPSFDSSDRIDLSQLRDEGGRVLDMGDIVAHAHDNIIDLSGFKTAAGASVVGYIELNEQAGLFDPITPFAASRLVADDLIFANGIHWQDQVPADFPIA